MVSTLRRVPFGRTQKEPKSPRPIVRPSLRSGSLAPALLRGPAATGHPWPIAALPASMPVDPLHRTSSRPPGRAGRSKALRHEAADRPACLNAGFATDIFPCGSRACPRCRHLVLSGGTKCWHRGQARSHKSWCWLNFLLLLLLLLLLWPLDCAGDANAPHRRPNVGAVMGVARQDAAPAAMGHGWPVAACPHNSAGERESASLGESAVW